MASPVYCFHDFRLDPASRELWRGEEEVTLQLKVFDCILYLIEHRDRAVGRNELIDAVWDDVHLSDSVLGKAISFARDALDDNGEEQRSIKTIRGYGYRWAAPVEVVDAPPAADGATGHRPLVRRRTVLAALASVALAAGALYFWQRPAPRGEPGGAISRPDEGSIALLLPVTVDAKTGEAWMRLGLMDHIAERLRAAGQPMVPSDTVISLLRESSSETGSEEIRSLTAATGARLVLRARIETSGSRWTLSLCSLDGAQPPLTAVGEGEDVLEAARTAADRMALSLGLTPAPEPSAEPGLTLLLQRIEAAILAQQMDVARKLIKVADPDLRQRSEVRFQAARLELHSGHHDRALAAFGSLLKEPVVLRDVALRTRVLHSMAAVHFYSDDYDAAEPYLEEAVRLLPEERELGRLRVGLGGVALRRHDLDAADVQLAHARLALEATGDVRGMAFLENNRGVLEYLRKRYEQALYHFERAANLYATMFDIGTELSVRANMVEIQLGLLEPQAAMGLEPRLNELLAQTTNLRIIAQGNLARVALLAATGQTDAAGRLLAEVLTTLGDRDDLPAVQTWALALHAEQLASEGGLTRAARVATEVVGQELPRNDVLLHDYIGRAWLVLLRTHLTGHDLRAAGQSLAAMSRWAERSPIRVSKIYAALGAAELAAAERQYEAAETAFEQALALADADRVPLFLLRVAESYVPWLLSDGTPDPERALLVVDRLARYAHQDYRVALLQLRVYHALGIPSAWRTALDRTQSLAGERQIPDELQVAPQITAYETPTQQQVTLR